MHNAVTFEILEVIFTKVEINCIKLLFYRKMIDWDEEMSPILLIIRDCGENVFGAIVSTTLRPCEHFFGTGDSCLLYRYVNDPDTDEKFVFRFFSFFFVFR